MQKPLQMLVCWHVSNEVEPMGLLHQRHVIVAISGGIAAYKGAELVRLLKKQGAVVRVILSRGAKEFITPLTLQALSGEPTHSELLDETAEAGMGHIELARWADLVVIAPGTADVIARLAQGRADDLLTTVALATPAPVAVAPAMNQQMWANEATQSNLEQLVGGAFRSLARMRGSRPAVTWVLVVFLSQTRLQMRSPNNLNRAYWTASEW